VLSQVDDEQVYFMYNKPEQHEMMKEKNHMPTIRVNDIDMYYEIHGAGEPVVLIAGLNSDHTMYRGILPELAAKYQIIVFDNRGVGQTDKPDIPYTIDMMAGDAAGLLQISGIRYKDNEVEGSKPSTMSCRAKHLSAYREPGELPQMLRSRSA
jgi:hypothetical protein